MTWPAQPGNISYADFLAGFSEFSNVADYPQTSFVFWQQMAYADLNPIRLKTDLDLAAALYIAHNLVLGKRATGAAANSSPVGEASGPVSSKSVGPVSRSFDTGAVAMKMAGPYNLTSYGQRLFQILRGASAGGAYPRPPQRYFGPLYRNSGWFR